MSIFKKLFGKKGKRAEEEEYEDDYGWEEGDDTEWEDDVEEDNNQSWEDDDDDISWGDDDADWEDDDEVVIGGQDNNYGYSDESEWDDDVDTYLLYDDEDDEDLVGDNTEEEYEVEYYDEDGNVIPEDELYKYDLGGETEEEDMEESYTYDDSDIEEIEDDHNVYDADMDDVDDIEVDTSVGLLDTAHQKSDSYEELLYTITEEDKRTMLEIVEQTDSMEEMFNKLEDADIDLKYLVALDVVSEEDIIAYRTMQEHGISEDDMTKVDTMVKDDYLLELLNNKGIDPTEQKSYSLTDTLGVGNATTMLGEDEEVTESEEVVVNTDEDVYEEVEEDTVETEEDSEVDIADYLARLKSLGVNTTEDTEEERQLESEDEETGTEEQGGITDEATVSTVEPEATKDKEDEVETDVVESTIIEDSDPVVIMPTMGDSGDTTGKVTLPNNSAHEALQRSKEKIARLNAQVHTPESVREILVVCEGIEMVEYLGRYKLTELKKVSDLGKLTLNNDTTLMLTNLIPSSYRTELLTWLGNMEKDKVRVVTLHNYEYEHELVQDVVDFEEESLDSYYEEHIIEVDKTSVGGMNDLSRFLGEF